MSVTGIQSSYDFSTGVKINMDELIYMISPVDTPLLNGVGSSEGLSVLAKQSVDQVKFDWMDEEMLLPSSTLSATVATTAVFVTVASGERTRFSTGDILAVHRTAGVSDERMRVTGYGTTADTLEVTRAITGTATNYASDDEVVALGTALAEGSDPEDARSVDRQERFNYTQIFGPTKISITRTEQLRSKYGISNELAHQTMLRMQEAAIAKEQAFLYGARYNDAGSKIRTTGGVDYYVTTNVDSTSTQLDVATIQSNLETCYDAGGVPNQLWANPKSLGDLNAANDALVQTTNVDTQRGARRVSFVVTEYGDVVIVRNRHVYKKGAFLTRRENVTRRIFSPQFLEKLAKTGDAENWQFVSEEGLQVQGQRHMAKFTNLGY